jgi:hypothetical protein
VLEDYKEKEKRREGRGKETGWARLHSFPQPLYFCTGIIKGT